MHIYEEYTMKDTYTHIYIYFGIITAIGIVISSSSDCLHIAREQLSISAIIEMAAAVRSIANVDETTLQHVTTLSIPLSLHYRVAIDSSVASVHIEVHPPLP